MMASRTQICLLLFLAVLQTSSVTCSDGNAGRKPYIIYLGNAPRSRAVARVAHYRFLAAAIGQSQSARDLMIHSYVKSFNAFAARLRPEEAKLLSEMDGVLSVFPSAIHKLHTTRSWDFLGFPQDVKRNTRESKMVIGLLDTGIWPQSPSFDDKGMGPPPPKWKGKCASDHNFTCNNKIVGAGYYHLASSVTPPDIPSPIDTEGHGTHTASTAVGSPVPHASLYGLASGTARGGVPSARVAMYKVCWAFGCHEIDMLAAFDQAIHDRVDVISVSIGGNPGPYLSDVLSIGSFHAMRKGILTCFSGGNDGPVLSTVSNVAPWVVTVAASAIDRQFRTMVRLGDGRKLMGISLNTFAPAKKSYPLTSGAAAANDAAGSGSAAFCLDGSLDKKKVEGKIVYCNDGYDPEGTVQALGGAGVIKEGDMMLMDVALLSDLPSVTIDDRVIRVVEKYINSTRSPLAVIYKSQAINVSTTSMASFSSRGPNPISHNILKPDIAAPGLDILAAWTRLASISGDQTDRRISSYNIVSGTSMSCPHVAGLAAYIKSFHPDWSPAAIKSAIMTTAKEMGSKAKKKDTELAYGSGQINPLRALDPGLVYDMNVTSYIKFLCKEGYDAKMIAILEGSNRTANPCPSRARRGNDELGSDGLNYPSMQVSVESDGSPVSAVFRRTVTNVGGGGRAVYRATVRAPKGMAVKVSPEVLVFDRAGQRRSFKVAVKGREPLGERAVLSASLVWRDGMHVVRSPIVVTKPVNF